jgi:hypothetical protein
MVVGASMGGRRKGIGLGRFRIHWSGRSRQQPERIDVCLWVAGLTHAEIDVRLGGLVDCGHDVPLGHLATPRDRIGAEVLKRHGVAVKRADGDRLSTRRDGAGEGDRAGDRRVNGSSRRCADVDAPVLAGGVGVLSQDEGSKHRPVDGPGPGERGLHADLERDEDRKQQGEAFHRHSSSLSKLRTARKANRAPSLLSSKATVTLCKACCARFR